MNQGPRVALRSLSPGPREEPEHSLYSQKESFSFSLFYFVLRWSHSSPGCPGTHYTEFSSCLSFMNPGLQV